jgi:hypothetical protein
MIGYNAPAGDEWFFEYRIVNEDGCPALGTYEYLAHARRELAIYNRNSSGLVCRIQRRDVREWKELDECI